jgi:hypothetical protein
MPDERGRPGFSVPCALLHLSVVTLEVAAFPGSAGVPPACPEQSAERRQLSLPLQQGRAFGPCLEDAGETPAFPGKARRPPITVPASGEPS